jgi:hypothetical protein
MFRKRTTGRDGYWCKRSLFIKFPVKVRLGLIGEKSTGYPGYNGSINQPLVFFETADKHRWDKL